MTWSSVSAHRLLCDLKFCSSASTHGLFFGLKFRLRIKNILRLKVPQFRFRIQNSVWLGTLKWRNSASAQGKYCGLEVTQLRFHTINLVRLESFAVSLPYKSFDFKSRSSASAQRISCDLKFRSFASAQGIYYVSKFSSSAFANRQSVTWSSSVSHNILPQEKTSFEIPHFCFCTRTLHFFGKSTLIQPPTHFLIFVLTYMTDGPSEKKRIGMLLVKVVVNVWLREDL